jgi:hypothetical protein
MSWAVDPQSIVGFSISYPPEFISNWYAEGSNPLAPEDGSDSIVVKEKSL